MIRSRLASAFFVLPFMAFAQAPQPQETMEQTWRRDVNAYYDRVCERSKAEVDHLARLRADQIAKKQGLTVAAIGPARNEALTCDESGSVGAWYYADLSNGLQCSAYVVSGGAADRVIRTYETKRVKGQDVVTMKPNPTMIIGDYICRAPRAAAPTQQQGW